MQAFQLRAAAKAARTKPALADLRSFAAAAEALAGRLEADPSVLPAVPIVGFHGDFAYRNMLVQSIGTLKISRRYYIHPQVNPLTKHV